MSYALCSVSFIIVYYNYCLRNKNPVHGKFPTHFSSRQYRHHQTWRTRQSWRGQLMTREPAGGGRRTMSYHNSGQQSENVTADTETGDWQHWALSDGH